VNVLIQQIFAYDDRLKYIEQITTQLADNLQRLLLEKGTATPQSFPTIIGEYSFPNRVENSMSNNWLTQPTNFSYGSQVDELSSKDSMASETSQDDHPSSITATAVSTTASKIEKAIIGGISAASGAASISSSSRLYLVKETSKEEFISDVSNTDFIGHSSSSTTAGHHSNSNYNHSTAVADELIVEAITNPDQHISIDPVAIASKIIEEMPLRDELNLRIDIDKEFDRIVHLVSPFEVQIDYRQTINGAFQQQIRQCLNAISFDASFLQTRCFLPSDSLHLTIILSQNQIAYWHTSLSDRLKAICDNGVEMLDPRGNNNNSKNHHFHLNNNNEPLDEMHRLILQKLTNVSVIHDLHGFKLVCRVGELDVEITANNRHDLCLISFLDELDTIIGKQHLFKRSLQFIRCWWIFEASNYAGSTPVYQLLSNNAFFFMIVTVFNIYWKEIRSPFYALYYFLKLFSEYDGKQSAITVQGIVPFTAVATNNIPPISSNDSYLSSNVLPTSINTFPCLLKPSTPEHILSLDLISKYWQLFNVFDPLNNDAPAGLANAKYPSESKVHMHMLFNSMSKSIQRFERFGFNIVHPFTHMNLIEERISSRKVTLLSQTLKTAFLALDQLVTNLNLMNSPRDIKDAIVVFLPNIVRRFLIPWRPDCFSNSIQSQAFDAR
jgi:hypothetical protein